MLKKQYWILLIILFVLVVGYLGRERIKNMLVKIPAMQAARITTPSSDSTTSAKPTEKPMSEITVVKSSGTKGSYVVGPPYGRALYIFDKDKPGVSNCTGECLSLWLPYTTISPSSTLPTNIGTIEQKGGIFQYTYKDMPLYYYVKDTEPGDVKGDGINGVWHLVKP